MSTQLAVSSGNDLQAWDESKISLLKKTICKGATDDELQLFMHICKRTGLDPFARQIYAIKRPNRKTNRDDMVVQTSIDGYRLIAEKTGSYAGSDDAVFDNEKEPNKATVTVYKMVQGQRCAFTASARWNEYCPQSGQDFMWRKMPCVMLSKVAEALALRKAFPADLSGMYTNEEMDQADSGRIIPEQPTTDDGVTDTTWRFTFGQWKQKTLEQLYNDPKVGPKGLEDYISWMEKSAMKKNEALSDKAKDAIKQIETFLGVMENREIKATFAPKANPIPANGEYSPDFDSEQELGYVK